MNFMLKLQEMHDHSRLLQFKLFGGRTPRDPLESSSLRTELEEYGQLHHCLKLLIKVIKKLIPSPTLQGQFLEKAQVSGQISAYTR